MHSKLLGDASIHRSSCAQSPPQGSNGNNCLKSKPAIWVLDMGTTGSLPWPVCMRCTSSTHHRKLGLHLGQRAASPDPWQERGHVDGGGGCIIRRARAATFCAVAPCALLLPLRKTLDAAWRQLHRHFQHTPLGEAKELELGGAEAGSAHTGGQSKLQDSRSVMTDES